MSWFLREPRPPLVFFGKAMGVSFRQGRGIVARLDGTIHSRATDLREVRGAMHLGMDGGEHERRFSKVGFRPKVSKEIYQRLVNSVNV
jgi:hypothetical protein